MLNKNHKIIAVIPAYNEAKVIRRVVTEIGKYVDMVIVVDDCSKDQTAIEAKLAGAYVVSHTVNKNYDGALNSGFAEAMRHGATVVLSIDADGQHKASDIPRIISPILASRADLVIGQRSYTSHPAEKLFALYTSVKFGVKDPLCGFKAYSRGAYEDIGVFDTVNSIGTELMLLSIVNKKRVEYVPIEIVSREEGDTSRFYSRRFKANTKIFKAMLRIIKKIHLPF